MAAADFESFVKEVSKNFIDKKLGIGAYDEEIIKSDKGSIKIDHQKLKDLGISGKELSDHINEQQKICTSTILRMKNSSNVEQVDTTPEKDTIIQGIAEEAVKYLADNGGPFTGFSTNMDIIINPTHRMQHCESILAAEQAKKARQFANNCAYTDSFMKVEILGDDGYDRELGMLTTVSALFSEAIRLEEHKLISEEDHKKFCHVLSKIINLEKSIKENNEKDVAEKLFKWDDVGLPFPTEIKEKVGKNRKSRVVKETTTPKKMHYTAKVDFTELSKSYCDLQKHSRTFMRTMNTSPIKQIKLEGPYTKAETRNMDNLSSYSLVPVGVATPIYHGNLSEPESEIKVGTLTNLYANGKAVADVINKTAKTFYEFNKTAVNYNAMLKNYPTLIGTGGEDVLSAYRTYFGDFQLTNCMDNSKYITPFIHADSSKRISNEFLTLAPVYPVGHSYYYLFTRIMECAGLPFKGEWGENMKITNPNDESPLISHWKSKAKMIFYRKIRMLEEFSQHIEHSVIANGQEQIRTRWTFPNFLTAEFTRWQALNFVNLSPKSIMPFLLNQGCPALLDKYMELMDEIFATTTEKELSDLVKVELDKDDLRAVGAQMQFMEDIINASKRLSIMPSILQPYDFNPPSSTKTLLQIWENSQKMVNKSIEGAPPLNAQTYSLLISSIAERMATSPNLNSFNQLTLLSATRLGDLLAYFYQENLKSTPDKTDLIALLILLLTDPTIKESFWEGLNRFVTNSEVGELKMHLSAFFRGRSGMISQLFSNLWQKTQKTEENPSWEQMREILGKKYPTQQELLNLL